MSRKTHHDLTFLKLSLGCAILGAMTAGSYRLASTPRPASARRIKPAWSSPQAKRFCHHFSDEWWRNERDYESALRDAGLDR
jgi:hypothetical protein